MPTVMSALGSTSPTGLMDIFSIASSYRCKRVCLPPISMTTIHDLLFADDCTLNIGTEADDDYNLSYFPPRTTSNSPDDPSTPTPTDTAYAIHMDSILTYPHCHRILCPRIGLIGHLRINCIVSDGPVPGSPLYTRHIHPKYLHRPCTFTHRVGLFGHMHIHESAIHRNIDTPSTSHTPKNSHLQQYQPQSTSAATISSNTTTTPATNSPVLNLYYMP
uniref:Uncharacterized protein n=2 Tax=Schistocephalus solidus TaxID=70667 RepID=A0A0X3PVX9_SCHSO